MDGWKAIAGHFGRNRSTVMRWADAGGFPIHRIAGRKGASVWAYADDLDAWLAEHGDGTPAARIDSRVRWRPWAVGAASIMIVGVAAIWLSLRQAPRAEASDMPSDPAVADLYLKARDDWATRTPDGIRKSIVEFTEVTRREPKSAAGYAGLAEAYVLAREFDSMSNQEGFAKATAAAKVALTLDPDSAEANRVMGFIAYWQRQDLASARIYFDRAIQRKPNDPQTHFWYGNILGDRVATAEALKELRLARALDPNRESLEADYAWLEWRHGPGDAGLAELEDLTRRSPRLSSAHRYLGYVYLSKADVAGYLDQLDAWAAEQGAAATVARASVERAAFRAGGADAVLISIANRTPGEQIMEGTGTEWPATAASMAGRRSLLLTLARRAVARGEHWASWRTDQLRFSRWQNDPEVTVALLAAGAQRPGGA